MPLSRTWLYFFSPPLLVLIKILHCTGGSMSKFAWLPVSVSSLMRKLLVIPLTAGF
jgi:hypothetical protein